ncbi:MAG: hypothetical protein DRJ03_02725 [Chloroflexi bacterium]|nr:MAG: hypothetical protein DRJ03_02725 [Chloroflexota bacterium]
MAYTRSQIISQARSLLREPVDGRFYVDDPEMYDWLDGALKEILRKVNWIKKNLTFLGNDATYYLSALGTTPKYYKFPADFMMLDPNFGVNINGIRQRGTSDKEVDLFQQKALAGTNDDADRTVTIDDYFSESYNGDINHYVLNRYIDDATYGNGYVMWFLNSPEASDTITLRYIPFPEQLATAGATSHIPQQFQELQSLGLAKRAVMKKFLVGRVTQAYVAELKNEYKEQMSEFEKYLRSAAPDKRPTIKTARQVFGMYNSSAYSKCVNYANRS